MRAYFEFDAHPEAKMEYTVRLDRARINKMPRFILDRGVGIGIGVQIIIARASAIVGAIRNKVWEEVDGRIGSLIKSLMPSAIG